MLSTTKSWNGTCSSVDNSQKYKEKETLRERGTKKYQERLAEEKEAEKEIEDYSGSPLWKQEQEDE